MIELEAHKQKITKMITEEDERKQKEKEKYEYEQNELSSRFNKIYEKNIGSKVCTVKHLVQSPSKIVQILVVC